MPTIYDFKKALVKAHRAGDFEAAQLFANRVKTLQEKPHLQIPGLEGPTKRPEPEPSTLGEKIIGAGETALGALSGATTGMLGGISGLIPQLGREVISGEFGSYPAARRIEQATAEQTARRTYASKTEEGQRQSQALAEFSGNVMLPMAPMAQPLSQAMTAGRMVIPMARARMAPARALPESKSIGAAQIAPQALKQELVNELPVPFKLTKGMRSAGDDRFKWARFERETAKDPELGAPIRQRFTDINEAMTHNMDAFVDLTGAEFTDLRQVGAALYGALKKRAAVDKGRINAAYQKARNAGETKQPVKLDPLAGYFNENWTQEGTAPLIRTAILEAKRLGIIDEAGENTFVAKPAPLDTVELLRQKIVQSVDEHKPNIRQATILKNTIDAATENAGGKLYKQARKLRANYGKKYEQFGLAKSLLATKRGTQDRQIALENTLNKTVLSPTTSLDDLQKLGRIVKPTKEGQAAWRELQGATVRWIQEQALKNASRDQNGQPIVSAAALDKAIKQLDKSGKLDYLLGRKGANQLRTIRDAAFDIYVQPPGSVNFSNTASVLGIALDMMASNIATGLPAPFYTAIKQIAAAAKNRKIKAQVKEALQ